VVVSLSLRDSVISGRAAPCRPVQLASA
jgi:hypothetical protein